MSENTCSNCGTRPSAIRGICRYCYATGKRPQAAPAAAEPTPVEEAPAAAETTGEGIGSAYEDAPKPKPKRRSRKKAD